MKQNKEIILSLQALGFSGGGNECDVLRKVTRDKQAEKEVVTHLVFEQ